MKNCVANNEQLREEPFMKILMVNKFLYQKGGSETYILKIGEYFQNTGHEVEYFGMEDEKNVVGNSANVYTSNCDFHTNKMQKFVYPFKIIYSREARKKIRQVIETFKPDVVHLNNFNFQITPSIIYEIKKHNIPIVFTAHDYQLLCPNHMFLNNKTGKTCEKCLEKGYSSCMKDKCIHGSTAKSLIGAIEGWIYHKNKIYKNIDRVICPSYFIEKKFLKKDIFNGKTVVIHNFIEKTVNEKMRELALAKAEKDDGYVLYFGRMSEEKGIETLVKVCKELKHIPFVFAGDGPLADKVKDVPNIDYRGFVTGEKLQELVAGAKFSVYTSEWYENCPFSVMESQQLGTPVIGAKIGGIPELIKDGKTGLLFESGNSDDLKEKINAMWEEKADIEHYVNECYNNDFRSIEEYCNELLQIYRKDK